MAESSGGEPTAGDAPGGQRPGEAADAGPPGSRESGADPPEAAGAANPFPHRQLAPPLDGGREWFNTAKPLELEALRGKFVLLDFWTYCCINCIHILPELKKLEAAYPNELVVIGVHSAKFTTEREGKNIREAVLRYEIEHPVVNDAEMEIWQRYAVRSWPSLRIVDPEGYLVAGHSGEIEFEALDRFLKTHLPHYRQQGLLDETPLPLDLEASRVEATPLRFPGKVLADEASDRLYIADSNHNRIVVTQLDGTLVETIGSGRLGKDDGDFATASFHHPQGMVLHEQQLYVADTENHLLRRVDLAAKQVLTVAGTGRQARGPWPGSDNVQVDPTGQLTNLPDRWVGDVKSTSLNSPWSLWIHGDAIYIAMAGPHQIWKMPLDATEIGPYAGNGREDIVDGPLLPRTPYEQGYSSFAQPSGLASDGTWLYVADSEGSSIRAVPFDAEGKVETVIGTAHLPFGRLFEFGDVDGDARESRLQHPLGVAFLQGQLYVADTYNNKVKVIDLEQRTCRTLVGTGEAGRADDPATFDEPAGIAAVAGKLYVADTNNHVIRVVDLEGGPTVSTLVIDGLAPPQPGQPGE